MHLAVRMLGNANDAAEAVQAALVKAYLNIKKLRDPARFEIWLLRIVANTAIDQRKAMKQSFETIPDADRHTAKNADSPPEKAVADELEHAVQRAMLKLSSKEARAIALCGLENLSQKQAAHIIGCSHEAVRWHIFRARQKLKILLKDFL